MVGISLIPLETICTYNDMFLQGWSYYEFALIVALDRKAVAMASKDRKTLRESKEPEPIPMSNAKGIRDLFRSIGAKKKAQLAAKAASEAKRHR